MEKEIKIEIKTDAIQALLEGKKLVYDYVGQPRITLIPDRYNDSFYDLPNFYDEFIQRTSMGNIITSNSGTWSNWCL